MPSEILEKTLKSQIKELKQIPNKTAENFLNIIKQYGKAAPHEESKLMVYNAYQAFDRLPAYLQEMFNIPFQAISSLDLMIQGKFIVSALSITKLLFDFPDVPDEKWLY